MGPAAVAKAKRLEASNTRRRFLFHGAVEGWRGSPVSGIRHRASHQGPLCRSEGVTFSYVAQDGNSSSRHHNCIPTSGSRDQKVEGNGFPFKDRAQMPILLFIGHWPAFGHMVTPGCKGVWEV